MHYRHLSIEEREIIQRGLWEKRSIRSIADGLGRSHTSIAREIRRAKSPERDRYTPRTAHTRALSFRTHRGRTKRLKNDRIRAYVITQLKERWSPEQIAGRIHRDLGETISHEAIYRFNYAQIKNSTVVKDGIDLRPYLRRRRRQRIPHGARRYQRVASPSGISIDQRPVVVARRPRIGDWEGDTVESCGHKPGVNTMVERRTGIVMITKLASKNSAATLAAVSRRFASVPLKRKRTLTLDNGAENRNWRPLQEATGTRVFFAHPYHSWERGTNENTNGLIRDYFPKKTDFTKIPDADIAQVEYALNTRPRKRLGFRTPLEVWSGALQG